MKRLDGAFADGLAGNEQFVSGALGEPLGAAPAPRGGPAAAGRTAVDDEVLQAA